MAPCVYIGAMKYAIFEPNLKTLTGKLTRLNAKLARINVPQITWNITGQHDEPHPTSDVPGALARYVDLEVEGTTAQFNGWEFVATIVHTDDGNIVRSVPGYTVPPEFRDRPTWCDHCKCHRVRRDTYIVRHTDARVMQVGSSCLADFIGSTNPNALTKASELLLNAYDICDAAKNHAWLGGTAAINTYRIDLDTFLNHVAAIVLKDGRYITRKIARETEGTPNHRSATSDRALAEMSRGQIQIMGGGHLYEVTPEAEKLAFEARQWVLRKYSPVLADPDDMSADAVRDMVIGSFKAANKSLSDFEHNLLSCARAESIETRLCGISAYIVEAYRRSLPRPQVAQLNPDGLLRIFAMFKSAAESKLTRPAIRLADDAGHMLHLSLAGAASKNAGYIYVKGDRGSDAYYGKISPAGQFFPAGACPATIEPQLTAFAADPETIAAKYGKLTGRCCFCGRNLTDDRSTEVGYGPVCAGKFGLNWGAHNREEAAIADAQAAAANVEPVVA